MSALSNPGKLKAEALVPYLSKVAQDASVVKDKKTSEKDRAEL